MLFKECFKIHIIEYHANQGNVFPKKSSYCKDHAIQGFVNQGPTVYYNFSYYIEACRNGQLQNIVPTSLL